MRDLGLFIDGAHLSILWRQISSRQLDFAKLQATIAQSCGGEIVEAYCFDATTNGQMNDYYAAMQRSGIRVKLYTYAYEDVFDELRRPICTPAGTPVRRRIQKGVDVGLATHLLDSHRRRRWAKLALIAGDADFAEPVQRLVEIYGVELTLIGDAKNTSYALRPYAASFIGLAAIRPAVERRLTSGLLDLTVAGDLQLVSRSVGRLP
ncbi:MAG: NYN domain-containing protein [Candidatus Cybelea sp.]